MKITAIIKSQQEILEQCQHFISSVSAEQYKSTLEPHFSSSPGKHIRHVLDHYSALKEGSVSGTVDYNLRNRESIVETSPEAAFQLIATLSEWLSALNQERLLSPLSVISEVSLTEEVNLTCQSTLARELMFVGSHAVHHYSLIAAILSVQGFPQSAEFGVAPATLSHQRTQQNLMG